jgi:cysteine-rich repeat protein
LSINPLPSADEGGSRRSAIATPLAEERKTTMRAPVASFIAFAVAGFCLLSAVPPRARAVDVQGTVHFVGTATSAATIPGIDPDDLIVSVKATTEATGNGEKCTILTTSSDNPDPSGNYPDAGDVSAEILLERGGPQLPEGFCTVTVQAAGTDGVSVSARGAEVVFVTANDIDTDATLNVDITVRESKAVAAFDSECFKWFKKTAVKRAKCNFLLLKKGTDKVATCQKLLDTGPEPGGCDPGEFLEAILAFSHGSNDQQVDLNDVENVDYDALKDQVKCQKRFGKAAANYSKKRLSRIRTKCLAQNLDSADCRDTQSNESKKKLEQIDRCVGDQEIDLGTETNTGRIVPDVEAPCDFCIDGVGVIDKKCMKACFQLVLDEFTDGVVGDIPVCGNGIVQPPEECDDDNLMGGDGCSATCSIELP